MDLDSYLSLPHLQAKLIYYKHKISAKYPFTLNNLVYLNRTKSQAIGHKVHPYYTPLDENDTTLQFESRFESGNLLAAFKMSEKTYHLVLQQDTNSQGYANWFYFSCSNTFKGQKVTFNILNMQKRNSLFSQGLKVLIYSEKTSSTWQREGTNVKYYENGLYRFIKDKRRSFNSLQFTYEFPADDDKVYIAYSFPYTYSNLLKDLAVYETDEDKYYYFFHRYLCTSVAGNDFTYLTINDNRQTAENKQGIVLMARVHPGESVGSFMMKGAIDFLCGNSEEAENIRRRFVIKIVPMLNIDGVVNGNYRCSLAGCDLNRRWKNPKDSIHPEIFYTKDLIKKFNQETPVQFVLDLHGHSNATDVFSYGNKFDDDLEKTKVFPLMLSEQNSNFNFDKCKWRMPRYKKGTARINLFNEINVPNIFTIEASYLGNSQQTNSLHWTTNQLEAMGRDICLSMMRFDSEYKSYHDKLLVISKTIKEVNEETEELRIENSEDSDVDYDSDSEESFDCLSEEELKQVLTFKKRRNGECLNRVEKNT